MFLVVGKKSKKVIWMFRAAYVGALFYFAAVCYTFYNDARMENATIDSIRNVSEWFSQAEEYSVSLYAKARLLNRKYTGLISRSDNNFQRITEKQFVSDKLELYNLARFANDRFFIFTQSWRRSVKGSSEHIVSDSDLGKEYDNLNKQFSLYFNNFMPDRIFDAATSEGFLKITQSLINENNTSIKAADIKIRKTLKMALEEHASHMNSLLEAFLKFALGGVVFLAVLIFLPIDYFLGSMLRRLREDNLMIKEAVHKAKSADRAKSEFLANMSHEIRTPMNGVMGMAELLMRTNLDHKQKTFADVIVKSGRSLLTIINDILDFSKIDAGQLELDPAPFRLAEAIEDVASLVSSKVTEKDLELAVRIEPNLPEMVTGDVGRFRQIATNLIGNAVKFTESGYVYVNVGGEVRGEIAALDITVKDTGIGISPEKCDQIFEKFSQVDETSTRKHEGTGLGLAISSALVELMGGEMTVESELGTGSTFRFTIELPIHGETIAMKYAPSDLKGSRVLIVDDNEVSRSIMSENMASWQFDSAVASNAIEALAVIKSMAKSGINLDCVILDSHMPDMSGAELAKAIRRDSNFSEVPIILMTSIDQAEGKTNFSALQIQGHLVKPIRASMLLDTIISAIHESQTEHSETISGVAIARSMANRDVGTPEIGTGTIKSSIKKPEDDEKAFANEFSESNDNVEVSALPPEVEKVESSPEVPLQNKVSDNKQALIDLGLEFEDDTEDENDEVATAKVKEVDILIAEDNEVNQVVFTQIMNNMGYSFAIAKNGREAIEFCVKYKPKLICMDVSMPEINGHEATQVIREMQKPMGIRTPIIGVTAHAVKGDKETCIEAGMDDYLTKPISPDLFEKAIQKWMGHPNSEKLTA